MKSLTTTHLNNMFKAKYPPSQQHDANKASFVAGSSTLYSSKVEMPDESKADASFIINKCSPNHFKRYCYITWTIQMLAISAVSSIEVFSAAYKEWIQGHPALVFVLVL